MKSSISELTAQPPPATTADLAECPCCLTDRAVSSAVWRQLAVVLAAACLILLATAGYLAGRLTAPLTSQSSTGQANARQANVDQANTGQPADAEPLLANESAAPFPLAIDALAAVSDERFSVATGVVSDQAEGFFVLDHNSGVVQCHVFYPRNGQFLASFSANVGEMIGGGKGAKYLMVTGQTDMTRGGRSMALSPTLLYVLNTTSGAYGVWAVPFDQQALALGRPQAGLLLPMGKGSTNLVPIR